jgi:hypothetical protein
MPFAVDVQPWPALVGRVRSLGSSRVAIRTFETRILYPGNIEVSERNQFHDTALPIEKEESVDICRFPAGEQANGFK